MPYNSIVIYAGKEFSEEKEKSLKARLKRLAGRRESAATVLYKLLVDPDPELWASALDDCFPDPIIMSAFIVRIVASHPELSLTLKTSAQEQREEADLHRLRILEAVDSLDEITPANEPITEENLDIPYFSPEAIEARLKGRLKS